MLPKSGMKKYLNLFFTMLKIGLFTIGGGYAMIALLENEFISKKKWIEKDEFIDMVAIAESTPGPVAINSATYIGYKLLGFWGSFLATIAVCIPSFAIIFVISLFFDAFLTLTLVSYAFRGIQACVIFLIMSAGLKMMKDVEKNIFNIIILTVTLACMVLFSVFSVSFSSIFYIIISGFIGLFVYMIRLIHARRNKK